MRLSYVVVTNNMVPGKRYFWGRRPSGKGYFISDSVPEQYRDAILQMENMLIDSNGNHLHTVLHALGQPRSFDTEGLIRVLHTFYCEETAPFEDSGANRSLVVKDMIATKNHLQRLVEKF